eukprot:403351612
MDHNSSGADAVGGPMDDYESAQSPAPQSNYDPDSVTLSEYNWVGIYKKFSKPYDMHLKSLEIQNGQFKACGSDGIGNFELSGTEVAGELIFKKAYQNQDLNTYQEEYHGQINQLKTEITGIWTYNDQYNHMTDEFKMQRGELIEIEKLQ